MDKALILVATVGVVRAAAFGRRACNVLERRRLCPRERVALRDPAAPASDFGSGALPQ